MKKLIFYFIVLLTAVWLGLKIAADPGYLLIDYQKVTIEMPLWLALILLSVLFFAGYYFIRAISNIRSLRTRFLSWTRARRVRRAWQRTHRGFIALWAGEYKLAEKDLIRAAPYTDTSILNYLGAAQAAQAQGEVSRRDNYLGLIIPKNRLSLLASGLTQVKLQIKQHQYEQALAKLQQLQQIAPKHTVILKLLKKVYLRLEDWGSLEILLPQLEKHALIKPLDPDKLRIKIYTGLLKNANGGVSLVWSRIPKSLKESPALLAVYIPVLSRENPDEAEGLLRNALNKNPDPHLLMLYGLLESSHKDKQLQMTESFLKTQPENPVLLLTLARLCLKNELWGKARSYFEASLAMSPSPAAYQELGQLCEHLGEIPQALVYYRQGLLLSPEKK